MADAPASADGKKRSPLRRALTIILFVAVAFVVYSFAFKTTDVDVEEIRDETRQESLFRVLRALAHPNLVTYETEEVVISAPVLVPCPQGAEAPGTDQSQPAVLTVSPACAEPGSEVQVSGAGFRPDVSGTLAFIPESEFAISLSLARFDVGADGTFTLTAILPEGRESENPQFVEAITRVNIGSLTNFFNPFDAPETAWDDANENGIVDDGELMATPRWSRNARQTWDKIIETVLLALLATTVGTAIAVPLSFMAARNLMRDISTTVMNLALNIIAIPVGGFIGWIAVGLARDVADAIGVNDWIRLLFVLVLPVAALYAFRWALPPTEDEPPTRPVRIVRAVVLTAVAWTIIVVLDLLGRLSENAGAVVRDNLGSFDFLGGFFAVNGQILDLTLPVWGALFGIGLLMSLGSRLGFVLVNRVPPAALGILTVVLAIVAGAVVGRGVAGAVDWFYEFETVTPILVPTIVGAIIAGIIALRSRARGTVGIGLAVYYIARTIFNTLRSIEPLVMVIVFVIWVGIGPFAGAIALGLHTTAALAKLYSEQVESISAGPIEAVRATGATRLQTVVYAVVPQIIPPYISFTMYRWDINVRMSTIIGFAGGGGIGFLLQQNTGLLQYRDAAAQMLAIAIVVASMDYVSSRLRERVV